MIPRRHPVVGGAADRRAGGEGDRLRAAWNGGLGVGLRHGLRLRRAAGYVDPEYLTTYQLTDKSDVYSFGALLAELVTGRPPVERSRGGEARLTTKWALQKCRGGEAVVAMDPRMRRSPASVAAVERMLALAAQCVAAARKDRPTMRRCAMPAHQPKRLSATQDIKPS
ncbi:unnamed protein product [Urochloa humidicola]